MRLIKCYIENFGLLHNCEFSFVKGINCCYSENSTGKTTLAAFIEAMLYGIGDTRKQLLDENPRKKYNPWQGGRYGGSLTVEVGKRTYTVERSFGVRASDDTFRLIDAATGKDSSDYRENIGESLFGIDRDGFLRTVFLSEKNLQGKNENKSISAKLSDLVGVDGDVGGYDEAIKLLDERRKFYAKKGNTGEIANVKERILEAQRRLDSLGALGEEIKAKEERLSALRAEKARLAALELEERKKLGAISKAEEQRGYEERYGSMLAVLEEEKAKLREIKTFFAAGIPSAADIDKARDAHAEAERLKKEAFSGIDDEEYIALRRFFGGGTDFVELAEMERSASLLAEKESELARIREGRDPISVKMRSIFPERVPSDEEIERVGKDNQKGSTVPKLILAILGILIAVGGIAIGGTYGYIAAAVGAIIMIASFIMLAKPAKSKELLTFVDDYSTDVFKTPKEALDEIRKNLKLYRALEGERDDNSALLDEEINTLKRKIYAFLERFPSTSSATVLDAISHIKLQYSKYYSLGKADAINESGKLEKLRRSEQLSSAVSAFMSKFPTVTKDPFSELREKLGEYNYLAVTVQRMAGECDAFAVRYGITDKPTAPIRDSVSVVEGTMREISEKIEAISREYTLVEREITLAQAEIDKKDEIQSSLSELEELLARHSESLEVIKKTSLYLKEACDNITSLYLGKTKAHFENYSREISGSEGEFSLSTDFELSKTERGASHGIDSYSRGTRDLYALAMRFALIDALYEKEAPFVILDDPFLALDDARLERAKLLLKSIGRDRQILYFTCSRSRAIE